VNEYEIVTRSSQNPPSAGSFWSDREVAKVDRKVAARELISRRQIEAEVRLVAYKADALAAFTGHAMERAVEVDMTRRALAGEDPALNAMLGRLEYNFVRRTEDMQNRLFSDFSF
jgi:hypothetical protein